MDSKKVYIRYFGYGRDKYVPFSEIAQREGYIELLDFLTNKTAAYVRFIMDGEEE